MKDKFAIIVTLLCSVHFFGLYYNLGQASYYVIDALAIFQLTWDLISKKRKANIKMRSSKWIIALYIALFISSISCYIYHEQNIVATIIAMRYFFYFLIYFQLHRLSLDKKWLEQLIIAGAITYMFVFFLQYLLYPTKIVNYGNIEGMDRGLLRFRIEGVGFLMLAAFLNLNRYMVNRKFISLAFYGLCMFSLFMLGFRTLLATSIISSGFLVLRATDRPAAMIRNLVVLMGIVILAYNIPYVQNYVKQMTEQTETQYELGDDYIRFQTFNFFIKKVNVDELSLFFGNGFPQENSRYGKLVLQQGAAVNGFIYADLGLIGFGIILGILSVSIFVFMAVKAIFSKLPRDSVYLSSYFLYLLISSITTVEMYRAGIMGIESLTLFLIDFSKKNN